MKQTPDEKQILVNFQPGHITQAGFLGTDTRHLHEIIHADAVILARLNISTEQIADKLQILLDTAKAAMESSVTIDDFNVRSTWTKGVLPCPFADPGVHDKVQVTVIRESTGESIVFSQLNIHLIKAHGFFQGVGSNYRLEPEHLVSFLKLTPEVEID
ncbi:hypothetical protein JW960_11440 [candidate division KSB1 bacterium]|nr:hypothetical protein [candidate division KSB1 bacterium]